MTQQQKNEVEQVIWGVGVDSFNRFYKFLDHMHIWDNPKKWYGFSLAYTTSDNLFNLQSEIKSFLKGFQPRFRQHLMDETDIKVYNALPDKVIIYRGMTVDEFNSGDFGVSWTLDKKVAEYFAFTYPRNRSTAHMPKTVHSIEVKRSEIIALFMDREEAEVLYLHKRQ